jgi:hypothetical protein
VRGEKERRLRRVGDVGVDDRSGRDVHHLADALAGVFRKESAVSNVLKL